MKKLLFFSAFVYLTVLQLVAQEPAFMKGNKVVNLGLGIGSNLYTETYYRTMFPPVSASFEVGVTDNILEKGVIGAGGYLAGTSYQYKYSNKGWNTTNIIIGARGNFHYPFVDKLDTYTGLMVGYGIKRIKYFGGYTDENYTGSSSGIQWAWFIGGRYYFRENLAVMAELGYGVTYINIGIALKL
jgi:hypothetical protein